MHITFPNQNNVTRITFKKSKIIIAYLLNSYFVNMNADSEGQEKK